MLFCNITRENGQVLSPTISQTDNQKKQADSILERFRNSSFFARIAQSDDPLWSRKKRPPRGESSCNAVSDKGFFDSTTAGGVARDAAKCFLLNNGDIVVRSWIITLFLTSSYYQVPSKMSFLLEHCFVFCINVISKRVLIPDSILQNNLNHMPSVLKKMYFIFLYSIVHFFINFFSISN